MKKRLTILVCAVVVLCQSAAFAARRVSPTPTPAPTPIPTEEPAPTAEPMDIDLSGEYMAFDQISEYVSELYINEYSKDDIMKQGLSELLRNDDPLLVSLLKSTFSSLDDYSEFYTSDEYKEFQNQLNHTFYGIGIIMRKDEDGYIFVSAYADGTDNAKNAGFQIGDKLYKVNGKDMTGLSMDQVREHVVGEEGTTVNITILRDGKEIELSAERVAVNAATVSSAVLADNIGYIQIQSFGSDTDDEFKTALDLMRENNVKKIILDLRNNGGGIVPVAISIAKQIVPEGKIIDVKYRQSKYDTSYTSDLKDKEFDFVVLVNEYTASSSEILASAIQESGLGKLIGTDTYGKAVIQNTYPLENGSVFKLTVGQYITRNGNEINKKGLIPDISVENVIEKLDTNQYAQFDYKTRVALGQRSDNVRAAKERLSLLGYYDGEVDDVYDTDIFDSVKTFQQMNDVFSYGVLDIPTQTLIEEQAAEINVVDDKQLKKAYEELGGDPEKLYENNNA